MISLVEIIKMIIHTISTVFLMVVYFKIRYSQLSLGKSTISKNMIFVGGLILLGVLIFSFEISIISAISVGIILSIRKRKLNKLCNKGENYEPYVKDER